jgi:anti-anti-sigma factor
MKIQSYTKDGIVVLEPEGRIIPGKDVGELDERLYSLLESGQKKVIIDLHKTAWFGSSGITLLLHYNCKFREIGGHLKLANLTKNIQKIIAITKLAIEFEIYDTLEVALNSFEK